MAAKTTQDSMGWLKLHTGMFSNDISGLSDTHVAIYIKLLVMYWSSGNRLPTEIRMLHRRLGINETTGEIALTDILDEFFPLDSHGNYSNVELDRQLSIVKEFSTKQSERASKPRSNSYAPTNRPSSVSEDDADNF